MIVMLIGNHRCPNFFVITYSNKIEVAYQEAVALKMQEELIREEEAAWMAESEQKAKRAQSEKEKKSKKKQSRQKPNNRKSKYKGREEKAIVAAREKHQEDHHNDENEASVMVELTLVPVMVDVLCDVSDSVDAATDVLQPDSEDRDASPVNWDTNTSEIHPPAEVCTSGISGLSCVQNGVADKRSPSIMDDSHRRVRQTQYISDDKTRYLSHPGLQICRGRNQGSKTVSDCSSWTTESDNQPCPALDSGHQNDVSESSKAGELEFEPAGSLSDQKIGPSRILFGSRRQHHQPLDLARSNGPKGFQMENPRVSNLAASRFQMRPPLKPPDDDSLMTDGPTSAADAAASTTPTSSSFPEASSPNQCSMVSHRHSLVITKDARSDRYEEYTVVAIKATTEPAKQRKKQGRLDLRFGGVFGEFRPPLRWPAAVVGGGVRWPMAAGFPPARETREKPERTLVLSFEREWNRQMRSLALRARRLGYLKPSPNDVLGRVSV
ncbi:Detected protein of unknown function [Hibiscus syriacus]|uniref:Uncharacterized protein n=1 Tax=Hibiscus syriacus TaxID=106335 RepID=A0A6A3D5X2_HIBSY|nr:Detected protein of unknown function [Hibiscus syriacus]